MICGVDEAGRGCIAGSLFMAGVILSSPIPNLRDSKKLTKAQRFKLESHIKHQSQYFIVSFEAATIDEQGLSACLKKGLESIQQYFSSQFHAQDITFLFDGNTNFKVTDYQTIIKGDESIEEIKAASILAKCAKDTEMLAYHEQYPHYGFNTHCGYGTKKHTQAIQQYGYLPIHRKSFRLKSLSPTLNL